MDIIRSRKLDDGVRVDFDNGWYYAHSITEMGDKTDPAGRLRSVWGWVNHLHEKRWWNPELEEKLIRECAKHL